nr:hypothetical protein Iba_chr12bCG18860 [Ipomoea batatas]
MKKNQGNREGDTILVKSYKFKENLKLLFEEERKEKRKMMLLELVAADRPSISDGLKRSDRWKKQTVRILGREAEELRPEAGGCEAEAEKISSGVGVAVSHKRHSRCSRTLAEKTGKVQSA